MTEFKQTESTRTGIPYGDAVTSAILHETAAWTDAQRELLSGAGTIWSDWLKRRCEAVEATSRSVQRIWESRTLAEFAQAQHDWLAGAVDRAAADVRSVAAGPAILTRNVGEFGRSAGVVQSAWPAAVPETLPSGRHDQPERAAAE